jgi:hypothetical protein
VLCPERGGERTHRERVLQVSVCGWDENGAFGLHGDAHVFVLFCGNEEYRGGQLNCPHQKSLSRPIFFGIYFPITLFKVRLQIQV